MLFPFQLGQLGRALAAGAGGGGSASDPHFANVVLLLNAEGADGSTSIVDTSSTGRTMTVGAGIALDTAQFPFGTSSIEFTNAGRIWTPSGTTTNMPLGSDDFTVEWFFRIPAVLSSTDHLMSYNRRPGQTAAAVRADINDPGTLRVYAMNALQASAQIVSAGISTGTWYHVAVTRSGGTIKGWLNGVGQGTYAIGVGVAVANNANSDCQFELGARDSSFPLTGHMKGVRVTKGVARYTANFMPPSAVFPEA